MASIAIRSFLTGVTLLVASAMLAGCTGDGGDAGDAGGAGDDATVSATHATADPVGAWGGDGVSSEPALALADDGTLTGTDGCNRLVGSWSEGDGTIIFDDVASTRRACEGVDTWLWTLAGATVDESIMTVLDVSGDRIGELARSSEIDPATVPSGEAEDFIGSWGVANTPGEPSLVVDADGSASGLDRCNFFSGTWGIDGVTLVFVNGLSTQVGCNDIDDWLARRATATVDGDTLTVFNEVGVEIGTLPRTG